jgi:hypothetical protein
VRLLKKRSAGEANAERSRVEEVGERRLDIDMEINR